MARRNRAYLRPDNTAAFECPACGATGIIRLETRITSSTPVRARHRCVCGRSHVVFIEKRSHVRKEVSLPGSLVVCGERVPITIKNLSRTGMMFEPEQDCELQVGNELVVEFQLEHAEKTPFVKSITVRHVSGCLVGVEFTAGRHTEVYDRIYDLALAQLQS